MMAQTGFARKELKPMPRSLNEKNILAQRRKGAKKSLRNAVALCAFAREILLGRATFRAKPLKPLAHEKPHVTAIDARNPEVRFLIPCPVSRVTEQP
jgi:hypothetical protein